jgi:hypothetical protein
MVKKLPVEIRLMILEFAVDAADEAELLLLGRVNRCLRSKAVDAFVSGAMESADGRRMVVFCDTECRRKKIRGLIEGIFCLFGADAETEDLTAMREQRVSLTCEVSTEGWICWWMTRESGRGPRDCTEGSKCALRCDRRDLEKRAAYLVLKGRDGPTDDMLVEHGEVAIAFLAVEALDMLWGRMIPDFSVSLSGGCGRRCFCRGCLSVSVKMKSFFSRLRNGGYSCKECCCGSETVCRGCASLTREQHRFFVVRGFGGRSAYGALDRDFLTDAVGFVDMYVDEWLLCWWSDMMRV